MSQALGPESGQEHGQEIGQEISGAATLVPRGKRAANRAQTRSDLATAAIALFERQGFADTTVDEIATASGVSRRTLFRHFPTKADIIFADHPERIRRLEQYVQASAPDSAPLEVCFASAMATIPSFTEPADFFLARYRLLRDTLDLRLREQAYGLQYTQVLVRFLRQRLAADDVAPWDVGALCDMIAGAIVAVVNRAQRTWYASGGQADAAEATAAGLDMLRAAFTPLVQPPADDAAAAGATFIVMNTEGTVPADVVKRLNSIFDPD